MQRATSWIAFRRRNDCYSGGIALVDLGGSTLIGMVCSNDEQNAAWQLL